jgi:hypothetical protein
MWGQYCFIPHFIVKGTHFFQYSETKTLYLSHSKKCCIKTFKIVVVKVIFILHFPLIHQW